MASRLSFKGIKSGLTQGPLRRPQQVLSSLQRRRIQPLSSRYASNIPAEAPNKKAESILSNVPGSNMVTKTAFLSAGAGLSVYLLSNEFYVINEETVVMLCTLSVFAAIFKYLGPAYAEWANGAIQRQRDTLDAAKKDHLSAVQARLESVQELGGVIDITKNLFEVSKETARLEAEAFELEQKTAVASEAKMVLDSWVRHEGQVKQKQQKDLAESVINKINKELENPKILQQILSQSVTDIENIVAAKSNK